MKPLKIFLIASALIVSLALPYVILAQKPAASDPGANQQTCPKNANGTPMLLRDCQKWIMEQAGGGPQGYGVNTTVTEQMLANKVGQIIGMVLSVFGIVFLCLVIYSGIQWMTAGGNEEKVSKARERIMRAAIGLGIIAMSWALTKFIVTRMQPTPAPNLNACQQAGGSCETGDSCETSLINQSCPSGQICCSP